MAVGSPLSHVENDRVTLRKPDGTVVRENLPALVRPKEIQVSDTSVEVCVDDVIEFAIPSGRVEKFIVTDPGYIPSPVRSLPIDRYLIKYVRADAPPRPSSGVTFNSPSFSGNSRINLQSVDNSRNKIGATSGDVAKIFSALRAATENVTSPADRERIETEIASLEEAHGSPSFSDQYLRFIGAVADHMTVFAPLLPALAALGIH